MAKRFFNTQTIEEDWYINLSLKHRELLRYCESKCDGAGIFSFNSKIASTYIGEKITENDLNFLPVSKLHNGKFFIIGYCYFQNGNLSEKSPAHKPIFKSLLENNIEETTLHSRVLDRVQEREKEREILKEEEKEKEKIKEKDAGNFLIFPFDSDNFMNAWNIIAGEKKWKNKSQQALQSALKILSNYSEQDAINMIEAAIAGEWQGIHELKNQNNGTTGNLQKKDQRYIGRITVAEKEKFDRNVEIAKAIIERSKNT